TRPRPAPPPGRGATLSQFPGADDGGAPGNRAIDEWPSGKRRSDVPNRETGKEWLPSLEVEFGAGGGAGDGGVVEHLGAGGGLGEGAGGLGAGAEVEVVGAGGEGVVEEGDLVVEVLG